MTRHLFDLTGRTVHEARLDVTDEPTIASAFEVLDAQGIDVDILVDNAGILFR